MGLDSMLCFSGHLEPSSIDARAKQSFSFSSQNWPHGSRAETRRENDAKSRCEIKTCEESEKFEMHSISMQVDMFAQCELRTKTSKTSLTALIFEYLCFRNPFQGMPISKAVNAVSDLILCADLFHNLSRFVRVKD